MSTYVERSALRSQPAGPSRAARGRRRAEDAGGRAVLVLAWAQLWNRTAGGSFERLPDPARHPECWFKIV